MSGFSVQDTLTLAATVCSCKYPPYPEVTLGKHTRFSELNVISTGRHRSKVTRFLKFQFSMLLSYIADAALTLVHLQAYDKLPVISRRRDQVINLLALFKGNNKITLQSSSFKQGDYCSAEDKSLSLLPSPSTKDPQAWERPRISAPLGLSASPINASSLRLT